MIESLSFLIHAKSKTGKTTLGATAPRPLMIDAEGGSKFLAMSSFLQQLYGRVPVIKEWRPASDPPPRHHDDWDICVVNVIEWATVRQVYQWLMQSEHDFQSICVDSITEIQRRCKKRIMEETNIESMQQQHWGKLLTDMDDVIRGLRDLTLHPTRPLACAIFIAESKEVNYRWVPNMQGAVKDTLPYFMDAVGYLDLIPAVDENGSPAGNVRRLWTEQSHQWEAGTRIPVMPSYIDSPNITQIYRDIYIPKG